MAQIHIKYSRDMCFIHKCRSTELNMQLDFTGLLNRPLDKGSSRLGPTTQLFYRNYAFNVRWEFSFIALKKIERNRTELSNLIST